MAYQKLSTGDIGVLPKMSEAFETYYTSYPDDDKAVHAYYYDAWARYRLGRWREASDTFNSLSAKYPTERYAPEALFRAGEALFNLTNRGNRDEKDRVLDECMDIYDRVVSQFPGSDYVDDALSTRLGR